MKEWSVSYAALLDAARRKRHAAVRYANSAASLMLGLAAQLVGFIVLARYLGTDQFGQLMAITAVTNIAANLCGLGAGEAMVRRVAREPSMYSALLGHNLILIMLSGAVLVILAIAFIYFMIDFSSGQHISIAVSILVFSNIVLFRFISLTEQIFIGYFQLMRANFVNMGFAIARGMTAVIASVGFGVDRLETWAFWHGAISVAGACVCIAVLWPYGRPTWKLQHDELWLGFHFSTPNISDAIRQNIDRLVLAAIVPPATLGIYSAATRIIQTSVVTLNSLTRLIYPKLAIAGQESPSEVRRLAMRYFPFLLGISCATALTLYIGAGMLPWMFGKDYSNMVFYVRVLCWILILVAVQNIAYDALGAAEQHAIRAHVFNSNAQLAVALIAGLTWKFGLPGTFSAIYGAQFLMSLSLWITLLYVSRKPAPET